MEESMKHTPGPWRLWKKTDKDFVRGVVLDQEGNLVADCNIFFFDETAGRSKEECRDNAAFIVRACNCHDELLAACKEFSFIPDCGGDWCSAVTNETDGLCGVCKDDKLCRWAYRLELKFKAAIAKAEGR
jgi:hypothetical protein